MQRKCCTVGKFESFHRGHRRLIEKAKEVCDRVVVISIRGVVEEVFTDEERREIARELGVELLDVPFSQIKDLSPLEFLQFLKGLGCSFLVVGSDWRFGRGRSGDVETARRLGRDLGIEVISVGIEREEGEKISTSRILDLLKSGDLKAANSLLGFPYFSFGLVVKGEGRGRELGFPTINVVPDKRLPLPFGVYAVRIEVDGRKYLGIANYGRAPTLKNGEPLVEIYVPNEEIPDLTGKKVRVEFLEFFRPEKKFNSVEELVEQIKLDLKYFEEFRRSRGGRGEEV